MFAMYYPEIIPIEFIVFSNDELSNGAPCAGVEPVDLPERNIMHNSNPLKLQPVRVWVIKLKSLPELFAFIKQNGRVLINTTEGMYGKYTHFIMLNPDLY